MRARPLWAVVAVAVCAILSLTLAGGVRLLRATASVADAASLTTESSANTAPGATSGGLQEEVLRLLRQAQVLARQPDIPGYDRSCSPGDGCSFGPAWTDDSNAPDAHNGCDTRNDVLRAQLRQVVVDADTRGCEAVSGILDDPYTGQSMDFASQHAVIHIDHVFPLAAAWDLGAAGWTQEERTTFANDTSIELLAVDASSNMSKSDSTPASWLPPSKTYRCEYVVRYLRVAQGYALAITRADVTVISHVAAAC